MKHPDSGLNSWQHASNHNRMIKLQENPAPLTADNTGEVKLTYFAGSAFQIETPCGLTVMVNPWRNHPSRKWDWYFADFPATSVDIGVSTHAHFDHDALHRLDASIMLDRVIGQFEFADVRITGIADKHATDSSAALYDFKRIIREFDGVDITPPDNPRSWDNCLVTIETGGLRILHWGDNRHNPPEFVWESLGNIDVLLLPVDDSQHVLGFEHVASIIERIEPALVVPHHYYLWDVVQRQSTLQPAEGWLKQQNYQVINANSATQPLREIIDNASCELQENVNTRVLYFADHVGFDAVSWRNSAPLE